MLPANTQMPRVFTQEAGDGVTVIVLHSSASTGAQWRSLRDCLSGRFRIVAPDLPGNGKSAPLAANAVDMDGMIAALRPLFTEAAAPVHLVGHSFGGAVALEAAIAMPEHVRSLTLIEPAAFDVIKDDPSLSDITRLVDTMSIDLEEGNAWSAMERFIDFWNGDGAWRRTSFGLQQTLARCVGQVMQDFRVIGSRGTNALDLAGVACPTLLISGETAPPQTRAIIARLTEALPFSRHVAFPDCGHMLPLTDPHLVDPLIADFLVKVDRGWQDEAIATALAA